MRKQTNLSVKIALLPLAITGLVSAAAQAIVLEEVKVVAKKREQSIYDVPVAISAFTGEAIEKQGISDLVDVGKFVPNLNVTTFSGGNPSSANPFIRGIGLQDHLITTEPGVAVYIDGAYLGRQIGQNWNLANIERLEVLRGPQGSLYGRNSIGGAINIITRKPGEKPGGRFSMKAGSRDRVNSDMFLDGALSDTTAASLQAGFKRRGGVGEHINLPNAAKDVGELLDVNFRLALGWTPNDTTYFSVAVDGSDGENGQLPYMTLIDEAANPTRPNPGDFISNAFQAGLRNSDTAANPYDSASNRLDLTTTSNRAWGLSVAAEKEFSSALLAKLSFNRRASEYRTGLDDDGTFIDFAAFPESGFAVQNSWELQLSGQITDAIDYVGGLYYFEEEGANRQDGSVFGAIAGSPQIVSLGSNQVLAQDSESRAIYGNLGWQATEDLRISTGIRYTEDDKDADVALLENLNVTAESSVDYDEVSWDLSANYELNDSQSVYATIASGYQSGTFPARPFCLLSDATCFAAPDENITALNYEIGYKGRPTDDLEISLSYFYTDYSDLPYQTSTTTAGGFNTVNVIVDQVSQGIEWESTWIWFERFSLHTSLGFIDVDVDDPNAEAPLTPEFTASISPEYEYLLDSGAKLNFRLDWSYRDAMLGEPSDLPSRNTLIQARDLMNFDFSYNAPDKKWTVALYGRNIFDERYDNARLNTGDYILVILNNDVSEFGVRFARNFDL